VERKRLAFNPIDQIRLERARNTGGVVDSRMVVNHDQARLLQGALGLREVHRR
jgi:hypothetical protein